MFDYFDFILIYLIYYLIILEFGVDYFDYFGSMPFDLFFLHPHFDFIFDLCFGYLGNNRIIQNCLDLGFQPYNIMQTLCFHIPPRGMVPANECPTLIYIYI